MKHLFYFAMMLAMPAMAQQTVVSTFEDTDVQVNEKNYWNGGMIGEPEEGDWGEDVYPCSFSSGLVTLNVTYNYMDMGGYGYDWWGGIALSQRTGTELSSLDDQYNNIVGSGANGSKSFGVIYGDLSSIDVNVEGGAMISGLKVVNSAYTMQNVLVGDGYSAKFQNEGDHIYLNIVATKADGTTKTAVVKLAEFTTELNYIKDWTRIGLDSLGTDVTKLTFIFDAHNSGVPQYACIDDIEVVAGINGPATFENLQLAENSYWNGSDGTGSFISGGYRFENSYSDYGYGPYATGFYYSNMTSTSFADYATHQYNSCVGHGAEGSANYAVYNIPYGDELGVEVLSNEEGEVISGFYVANAASAYQSMLNGDSYAKKFGEGDWFMLTITGINANGETTGSVDFYLADCRDASTAYILSDWRWIDLTSLGKVKRLGFSMSSSDNSWGYMNTPAYFSLDNLGGTKPEHEEPIPTIIAQRTAGSDLAPVAIYNMGGARQQTLQPGMNIVKYANGTTRKVFVK